MVAHRLRGNGFGVADEWLVREGHRVGPCTAGSGLVGVVNQGSPVATSADSGTEREVDFRVGARIGGR